MKNVKQAVVKSYFYDVVDLPWITEKTTSLSDQGKVVFKVKTSATKGDIKDAVEALFNVSVNKVNTITVKGKRKIFRNRSGQRSDYKKAIVTLKDGQSIDFASGV